MRNTNPQEPSDIDAITPEKHQTGIKKFFFGSLPRTMITILVTFMLVAIIHALLTGPDTGKKKSNRKIQNQAKEDLSEANKLLSEKTKTDQEKILALTKENQALKGQGLKEEIKLQQPSFPQQPAAGPQKITDFSGKPPVADAQKQAPAFQSPADAVNYMAAQEQKKAAVVHQQPMQRVMPPLLSASAQAHQSQSPAAGPAQENKKEHEKNLLGGSRASGSLYHGVAAVSGLPYPVVIDLTSVSVGPNATSRPIKDCAIIAAASADLSSARVYMQAKTLNCYIGGQYIEQAVDGYIIDMSDGLIGLRGRVDERSGPYIAELILASFAAGISKGLAVGETTTMVSASTGTVTTSLTGNATREGLYSGASSAAEKLAHKLEQKADKFLPFVEVLPTDKVQVVFSTAVHVPDDYHGVNMKELTWIK
ncbi:MAG: hypothetical protein HQL08_15130 [Nitrospirae bacterium]|nr:hypothetical protein [Nitrospirota bacterium]